MSLIDRALAVWDEFLARRQIGRVQVPVQRVFKIEPQKRAIPSYGADNDGFTENWADYRVAQVNGPATTPQKLEAEMKSYDADLEKPLVPNPDVPSPSSHGRSLNYSRNTDQRPPIGHDISPADKAYTPNGGYPPKKSFLNASHGHDKTEGDRQAEELRKYPFDFSV